MKKQEYLRVDMTAVISEDAVIKEVYPEIEPKPRGDLDGDTDIPQISKDFIIQRWKKLQDILTFYDIVISIAIRHLGLDVMERSDAQREEDHRRDQNDYQHFLHLDPSSYFSSSTRP